METQNTQTPVQAQAQPVETPGFMALLKASLQILKQNWKYFVKMTLALLVPALVLGGLIFFVAIGFQNKANAAPGIPTQITDTAPADENIPVPAVDTVVTPAPDANVPATDTTITPAPDATVPETVTTTQALDAPVTEPVPTPYDTNGTVQDISPTSETTNAIPDSWKRDTNISINSSLSSSSAMAVIGMLMSVMGVILLLLFIPFIIYMLVATLAMIRLTVLVTQGAEIKIWEIIKWAFSKIGSYLMLSLRILVYVLWPFIAVIILTPILGFISGAAHIQTPFIGYFLMILSIAAFVLMIIRAPRASFAKYILAEKECSSKEALAGSIAAATNHWGKIIGYSLLLALIASIFTGILVGIFSKISQPLGSVVSTIISIGFGYVAIIFAYGLYNLCKMLNERKTA